MLKIDINHTLYPYMLKIIPNPPKEIYLEGNYNLLSSPSIAIIGSRHCSQNGKNLAQKFSKELSMSGITIISGLAQGIDTIAHINSYANKGKSIIVLGNGLNNIFPQENIPLYNKIIDSGGLAISEYPPDVAARSSYFLERNRIVSGLSLGIIVIEAQYRSGTSVTAKYAVKQNKSVFTLPHEIWDKHGVGTNRLLKNGAQLVTSPLDVIDSLNLKDIKHKYIQLKNSGAFNNSSKNMTLHKFETIFEEIIFNIIQSLSKNEKTISIETLLNISTLNIQDIYSALFLLETKNYIKKTEGGYIINE